MALFYTLDAGDDRRRWYITRSDAEAALATLHAADGGRANPGGGAGKVELIRGARGLIREEEVDELIMRQWAANWANQSEVRKAAAKKREASKTPEQRSEIMKKAWEKRKSSKNMVDK